LIAVIEAFVTLVLIALLVTRELIDAAARPSARAQLAALRVAIVPLLVLFSVIVARRVAGFLG
jgi:uncharacterized membrane protein